MRMNGLEGAYAAPRERAGEAEGGEGEEYTMVVLFGNLNTLFDHVRSTIDTPSSRGN